MYKSIYTTVCNITGWIPFTTFNGVAWPYMVRDHCPKVFINKESCEKFCNYLNNMDY